MAGMDWFRWHHGSVTDPKFQLIARKTKSRVSDVIAVWAFLLEAASQADQRGNPGAQDFEAIDCALGLDDGQAAAIHASMIDRGIVESGGVIAKWEARQPKREREGDNSTERSRTSRAKKNQQEPTPTTLVDATPCNAMQRQETPRVEEIRVIPPIPPSGVESGSIPEKQKTLAVALPTWLEEIKSAGEKPVPENDPVFVYAEQVGIPQDHLRLCWREFRHRYSQPGAKRYRDWRGVFRKAVRGNWLKLWWVDGEGAYALTTCGKQAEKAAEKS